MDTALITLLIAILPVYTEFVPAPLPSVYGLLTSSKKKDQKALDGWTGLIGQAFELDIMAKKRSDMVTYFERVEAMLKALEHTTHTYLIQEVSIDENCPEFWESEVKMNRKLISFTISYQK